MSACAVQFKYELIYVLPFYEADIIGNILFRENGSFAQFHSKTETAADLGGESKQPQEIECGDEFGGGNSGAATAKADNEIIASSFKENPAHCSDEPDSFGKWFAAVMLLGSQDWTQMEMGETF